MESHLLQMRGLKHRSIWTPNKQPASHLLQMRGLKLTFFQISHRIKVASFTDAWIETDSPNN